jgi:hypothetical protein
MSRILGCISSLFYLVVLYSVADPVYLEGQTEAASTVLLSPGDNLQVAVNNAPAGTTFVLREGVYRMQEIFAKSGDIFNGEGKVVLNGSQILSFSPDPAGSGMWVATASTMPDHNGRCSKTSPLCGYVQDLFVDDVLQTRVSGPQNLAPGQWYFDMDNHKVYVPTDPSTHIVEIGMTEYAILGHTNGIANVQINNLIIEKYAVQAQFGVIGAGNSAIGWVVNRCEVRWNHSVGINLGPGSQITNSYIHHNGELGFELTGSETSVINNEISWNNYAGYDVTWNAGADHVGQTNDLVFKSNYIHDNEGCGVWTDTNDVGTIVEDNTITHNGCGIRREKGYSITIDNNTLLGNSNSSIYILASSGADIYGNTIEVPSDSTTGIGLTNDTSDIGTLGPYVTANNEIHNNTITYQASTGVSGLANNSTGDAGAAVGNQFDYNRYILLDGGESHWDWFGTLNWSGFQAAGEEQHGSCCS